LSLVLLDLALPKLDGNEVFAQMNALGPAVRIIITSGYDEKEAKYRYSELASAGYLQKPFNRATLLAAVRTTLAL
jgi:DNA-binding response OmpR family regulator